MKRLSFFEKFKNGDANNMAYRMALIDIFINKVYVFDSDDSRVEIYCNAIKQKIISSLGELTRSPKEQLARLKGFEPLTHGLEGRCSILLSYRRTISGYITY